MSKHKLIMENWRKFLTESDRGYPITTLDGDDVYLYHDHITRSNLHQLTLYTIAGDVFLIPPDGEWMEEMLEEVRVIGGITFSPVRGACIPQTFEVGSVHTHEDFERQGFGTLLYDLAMYITGKGGGGLTSDRLAGTKTTASEKWQKMAKNDAKYEKRKTPKVPIAHGDWNAGDDAIPAFLLRPQPSPDATHVGGNDTFDYHFQTPDPEDDCTQPRRGNTASHHSLKLKDLSQIKTVYDGLAGTTKGLIKWIQEQEQASAKDGDKGNAVRLLLNTISDIAGRDFIVRYDKAKE